MPTFETPDPIEAVLELIVSDVRIAAADRAETVVEVRPSDGSRRADVQAAEQTRVEYSAGRLFVKSTGRWKSWSPFGYGGAIEVDVELPAGSRVQTECSLGSVTCTGPLGDCRIKTVGDIHVDEARQARLASAAGNIELERAHGDAELTTASGDVRAEAIGGAAAIKNSNGDTRIGEATGELSIKAANGDIEIARSHGRVVAKTANGDIRIGAAERGSVEAETGYGALEIAIPEGTAVWLDVHTGYGRFDSELDAAEPPEPGADTVEVHARSGYGDVRIRRRRQPATHEDTPS
jgi:hypothetical protein